MCEVDLEDGQRKEEWQSTQENRLVLRGAAGAPPSLRHRMWMQRGLVCVCVCWCVCVCVGGVCVCVGVCVCLWCVCVLVCVCMCVCVCWFVVCVCMCWCVCVLVCVEEEAGGGGGGGETRDTESKTRTPHKDVGKTLSTSALKLFKTVSTLVETCSLPRTVSKLLSDLSLTQKMVSTNCPFQHRMLLVPLALC